MPKPADEGGLANIQPELEETGGVFANPPSPNSSASDKRFFRGRGSVCPRRTGAALAQPRSHPFCACYSPPSRCRSRPWRPLHGPPGRSGPAASPSPSGSPRWPRRPPCASGTAPATSTAARTSQAATAALSATPALAVLHALIFDFLNHRTGRLDPSYAAIAAKAGVCVRTVATALQRLKALGILNWVRRCAESWQDGRFVLEQETNAYGLLPESQWRGYRPPQEPPAPRWPGTWGDPPPMPLCARPGGPGGRSGGQGAGAGQRPEGRPGGRPGAARAGVHGPQLVSFPGVQEMRRNLPQS